MELLSRHKLGLIETLIVNMINSSTYCQAGHNKKINPRDDKVLDKNNLKISCCDWLSRDTSTTTNYISNFPELLIDYLLKTGLSWLNISLYQWPAREGEVESGGLGLGWIVFNYK